MVGGCSLKRLLSASACASPLSFFVVFSHRRLTVIINLPRLPDAPGDAIALISAPCFDTAAFRYSIGQPTLKRLQRKKSEIAANQALPATALAALAVLKIVRIPPFSPRPRQGNQP